MSQKKFVCATCANLSANLCCDMCKSESSITPAANKEFKTRRYTFKEMLDILTNDESGEVMFTRPGMTGALCSDKAGGILLLNWPNPAEIWTPDYEDRTAIRWYAVPL